VCCTDISTYCDHRRVVIEYIKGVHFVEIFVSQVN
jgi:hypothetical protein